MSGKDLTCSEYDVSICAKDSSGPYDYEMTSKLVNLAKVMSNDRNFIHLIHQMLLQL